MGRGRRRSFRGGTPKLNIATFSPAGFSEQETREYLATTVQRKKLGSPKALSLMVRLEAGTMRKSNILTKIAQGQTALATTLHLIDPSLYELVALMGFDGIWMDMEHHGYSVETAAGLMRAARVGHGADIIARPGKGEFMRMARMLEIGATGIMYPRCDSVDEAREVVRWAKFAPLGQRGFDGAGADAPYCVTPIADYISQANAQTFVLIQMEEPKALQQAEAIAAVPGVDMIMLGPADFSVLTGIPGQFDHPTIDAAIRTISRAAKNTGKQWASTCGSLDQARRMIDLGCRLILHGADIVMMKNGLENIRRTFAKELNIGFGAASSSTSYLEKA
jgi:4-hydroxy-2-oxoheptanedioate aldolase